MARPSRRQPTVIRHFACLTRSRRGGILAERPRKRHRRQGEHRVGKLAWTRLVRSEGCCDALGWAGGLSQSGLAERAGLSLDAVAALEQGTRRAPYPRTVHVLAEALHLSETDRADLR